MAKKKKENKKRKVPMLKHWMIQQGITQKELRERTDFGTGTMNRLVNYGEGSKSIVRHLALELGITHDEMKNLLKLPA